MSAECSAMLPSALPPMPRDDEVVGGGAMRLDEFLHRGEVSWRI